MNRIKMISEFVAAQNKKYNKTESLIYARSKWQSKILEAFNKSKINTKEMRKLVKEVDKLSNEAKK